MAMGITQALKLQQGPIDSLARLPQQQLIAMAQQGRIPADVLPVILNEKAQMAQQAANMQALQRPQAPSVIEQAMATNAQAEAQPEEQMGGIAELPIDESLYGGGEVDGYAGGGIVAFAGPEGSFVSSDPFADVRGGKPKNPFEDVVAEQARRLGQDPRRAVEIFYLESGALKNAERAISPKGAIGLMQIMPETAMDPGYGVPNIFDLANQEGISVKDRSKETAKELLKNPAINAKFGSMYRTAMEQKFGGPSLAAAAYNAGPGAVERAGGVPNIAETKKYVSGISPQRANFIERQEAAAKRVQQARREQLETGTLSPTGQPIIPGRSVMEKPMEPPVNLGSEKSPFPSREEIAGRQQLFADYLFGNTPIPAPTRAQQMLKERIEKEGKEGKKETKQEKAAAKAETPKEKTYGEKLEELIASLEGRRAEQLAEDKNMALLAAGLGMMSGTSPYAFTNVGTGAMKGVEQYNAARKAAQQQEQDILAARLGQYRYGEEARMRDESRRLDQGMRLASLEEERIRKYLTGIAGAIGTPQYKQLQERLKQDPNYIENVATQGRNRILKQYGLSSEEEEPASTMIDFASIQPKKK